MRGLLVIEPLYHQIIAGNKTQTRRSGGLELVNKQPENWEITGYLCTTMDDGTIEEVDFCEAMSSQQNIKCNPRYHVGEVLYIKEPIFIEYDKIYTDSEHILYKYDNKNARILKWSNKLFMGAKDARAFIRITSIRCESLLDISDDDCIAEGVNMPLKDLGTSLFRHPNEMGSFTPKESFMALYRFANKIKKTPEIINPWVWVYDFEYLPDYKHNP